MTTCTEVLTGVTTTSLKKEKIQECKRKRDREKANGTYLNPNEKKKLKAEEKERWKQERKAILATETKEQKKKRVADEKEQATARKKQKYEKRMTTIEAELETNREFFGNFMNIKIHPPKGYVFANSFKTDGISARLFYKKIRGGRVIEGIPKRGLYTIDQMKHLSKLDVDDMQIIGIDPGMRDLIHAVDLDHMLNRAKSVTYTSAQRRSERASSQFARCMQNEKSELIKGAEQELSQYNSRSNYRYKLMDFFHKRHVHMEAFFAFYERSRYRTRRWRSFKKDQQSVSNLINQIKGMKNKDDPRTMILAYGSWVNASATFNPKGIAPCIGIGLRRRLAKEFIVVDTPEHYTSQTCCKCFQKCGPFKELEEARRKERMLLATDEKEKKKASRLHVRGIRRCQNAECGAILHRDRNGACCIAINCRRIWRGEPRIRKLTAEDIQLEKLQCAVCLE